MAANLTDSETRENKSRAIGIFGGAFDPVHNGHVSIVKSWLSSGYIDELWVFPTPSPPVKSKEKLAPYTDRLEMARRAFSGFKNVRVSDYESRIIGTSYTWLTLENLNRDFPDKKFYLCIGADNLQGFKKWKNPNRILELADLLVAGRPGFEADKKVLPSEKVHRVEHHPVDISSTEIRKKLTAGQNSEELPSPVIEYIREKKLYSSS